MKLNNTLSFYKNIKIDIYLACIIISSIILRCYNIGFQDAWLDEIHTLKESDPSLSFKEFSDVIMFREGISHFYFLIVRFFFELVGQSIANVRLISAFFGVLSIYYIYKIGKKLFNQNTGYLAALFLALNLTHIEYSQEARVYSMYLFFVILSIYHLLIFNENRNYKNAIILGISTGLIANSHSIGLLNVAVIFIVLFTLLVTSKGKTEKISFLKQCVSTGIAITILFIPVYQTIKKTSQYESFWVAAPTFGNIKQVFVDLAGKSIVFFYLSIILLVIFILISIYNFLKKDSQFKQMQFNLFLMLFWLLFCSGTIIIKSYSGGGSLILTRYFISVLPVIVLVNSLAISYLKNKYLGYVLGLLFSLFSLYFILIDKDYYNTISKTQFSSVTNEILDKKTDAPVFSSWGWLMSYYINDKNSQQLVTEMTFEDYVTAVKNNAVRTEAFWFMDGNQRPINLSAANQEFLNENFKMVYSIEKFDAWAKYYEPIEVDTNDIKSEINLYNNDFKPLFIDGNGNLMIFENSEVKSRSFNLQKGNYELILSANSLPLKKINDENAHLKIRINQEEIADFYLNEDPSKKEIKIPFYIDTNKKIEISLIFDNDVTINGFDRNVVIYSVKINKK